MWEGGEKKWEGMKEEKEHILAVYNGCRPNRMYQWRDRVSGGGGGQGDRRGCEGTK